MAVAVGEVVVLVDTTMVEDDLNVLTVENSDISRSDVGI